MLPDRRAVIFDLDDTLYPYRRFVLSGFAAVAAHLERGIGISPRRSVRILARATRGEHRGRELQLCLTQLGLSQGLLPTLRDVLVGHHPRLRLSRTAIRTLHALRDGGWRIGVLTNGPRAVQARKVATLGLARYVDTVIYATEHGTRQGKPDTAAFSAVLRRLDVPARHAVFVGDDPTCDIDGAARAGMLAVRCQAWVRRTPAAESGMVIDRLAQVPEIARVLLEEAMASHAA